MLLLACWNGLNRRLISAADMPMPLSDTEKISLKRLIGAAFGSVLGMIGAYVFSLVLAKATPEPFLQILLLFLMTYIGLVVGAKKGDMLNLSALGGIFGGEKTSKKTFKILDTSVIIDGRIAVAEKNGLMP